MKVDFLLISLFAANITIYLAHKRGIGPLRASAGLSLGFALINLLLDIPLYSELFVGASFVGMSSYQRLSHFGISLASILFVFVFFQLQHYFSDLGGLLGFSAFVACCFCIFLKWGFQKLQIKKAS